MQATSLASYTEIKKSLGLRQLVVLNILEASHTSLTNTEIAKILMWPINCVVPRIFELRGKYKRLVKEHEKRKCNITGKTATAWRITTPDERIDRQGNFGF